MKEDITPTRSITFDKEAQENLPEWVKDKMKADREKSIQRQRAIADRIVSRIKKNPQPLTIADGYVGFKFLHYSDDEKRWNEVRIKQVDPNSVDVINVDENSDEYHNVWTITDAELLNINNSRKL